MLHLLRTSLQALADGDSPASGPASRNLSREGLRTKCGAWTSFNDVRLMQGVLKHGYGRWGLRGGAGVRAGWG